MSELSVLAKNIEQRKRELGIAKSIDLANKSGVSRAVLTNIKKMPEKSIMFDSAINLAKALECRLEWLGTGEGSPTTDEYVEAVNLSMGAPVVSLNKLITVDDIAGYLANRIGAHVTRLPCPSGNAVNQFVVKVNEQIKNYPAGGYFYFDILKVPISGQLIVANTGNNIEIMEYQSAHGRQFLKSLNDDLPMELRLIEIGDQQLIGTFSAYALF